MCDFVLKNQLLRQSEAIWGINLKLCRNVHTLASTILLFFIAVAYMYAFSLLWQLKSFHRLTVGKMKIGFICCLIADILTEVF